MEHAMTDRLGFTSIWLFVEYLNLGWHGGRKFSQNGKGTISTAIINENYRCACRTGKIFCESNFLQTVSLVIARDDEGAVIRQRFVHRLTVQTDRHSLFSLTDVTKINLTRARLRA